MPLLADRFVCDIAVATLAAASVREGEGVDLASGDRVWLRIEASHGDADAKWQGRCQMLSSLRHPAMAALIDWGALDTLRRFEAWDLQTYETQPGQGVGDCGDTARAWLQSMGLSVNAAAGNLTGARAPDARRDGPWVPSAECGYSMDGAGECVALVRDGDTGAVDAGRSGGAATIVSGMRLVARPTAETCIDVLASTHALRSRLVSLWAPVGYGRRTIVQGLARAARLQGLTPLAVSLMHSFVQGEVSRPLMLVVPPDADSHAPSRAIATLLSATRRWPLAHALVFVGEYDVAGSVRLVVEAIDPDRLAAAWCPAPSGSADDRVLRHMARRVGGAPAAFVRGLGWQPRGRLYPMVSPRVTRVAEASSSARDGALILSEPRDGEWWRARQRRAAVRLDERRGEAEVRELRRAAGAVARRVGDAEASAATSAAALALADHWLARGSVAESRRALQPVLTALSSGEVPPRGEEAPQDQVRREVKVARVCASLALVDLRLDEAETLLETARQSAHAVGLVEGADVALDLACVQWWRGRFELAEALLEPLTRTSGGAKDDARARERAARITVLRGQIAVGRGDLPTAFAVLTQVAPSAGAVSSTSEEGGPCHADSHRAASRADRCADSHRVTSRPDRRMADLLAQRAGLAALARLCVGDADAAERDARDGLVMARRARRPLWAILLRVLTVEAQRRLGRPGAARALGRWSSRATRLPPLWRTCLHAGAMLARAATPGEAAVDLARLATSSGLGVLTLLTPSWQAPVLNAADNPALLDAGVAVPTTGGDSPSPQGGRAPYCSGVYPASYPASPPVGSRTHTAVADHATANRLLRLLHCCHDAREDADLLANLAEVLRELVGASGVAFVAHVHGDCVQLASAGARLDRALADRVGALRVPLLPIQHEAATPPVGGVAARYGDRVVGALLVRWPAAIASRGADTCTLLTASAALAAPAIAAEAARRAAPVSVPHELVGPSDALTRVRRDIERVAAAPFPVLILGESGTGKELAARAIHRRSARRDRPCHIVNCAAIPDDLVEAELFGHARGAFTGAVLERPGVFEAAHGGTLFLDEIGELSPRAQAKVLRTIQEGEVRRLGESVARRVDVRLIAATNRDLEAEVAAGRFRHDLRYRLDVVRLTLPPLRERPDDVPVLAERFWRRRREWQVARHSALRHSRPWRATAGRATCENSRTSWLPWRCRAHAGGL